MVVGQADQIDPKMVVSVFEHGVPDCGISVVGRPTDNADIHHVPTRGQTAMPVEPGMGAENSGAVLVVE